MAVLKSFDFATSQSRTSIPWNVLLNGQIHELKRVKTPADVKDTANQFYQKWFSAQIKDHCERKGIEVRVAGGNPASETCVIQAVIAPAPKTPKKSKKS